MQNTKSYLKTPKGIATIGIGVVFAISVYGSGWHIIHVALHYGQSVYLAGPLPVSIDMFAFFCAIKLRAGGAKIQKVLNRLGMWSMLTLSLWFNIESALIDNVGVAGPALVKAIVISAAPAAIVALAAEILTHTRSTPARPAPKPRTPSKAPGKAATARKTSTPTRTTPNGSKAPEDLSTVFSTN